MSNKSIDMYKAADGMSEEGLVTFSDTTSSIEKQK